MLCDILSRIDEQIVKDIFALCAWDPSPEGIATTFSAYKTKRRLHFYGAFDDGLVGIVGFQELSDAVEILHIAVLGSQQKKGIGKSILSELQEKYQKPLEAETDEDAVEFYRKCGFSTIPLFKYGVRRYACTKEYHSSIRPEPYHTGTIALETPRLLLRKFSVDDATAMYHNWASDPQVSKFLTWPTHESVDETRKVLSDWVKLYSDPSVYHYAIILKEIYEPIGSIAAVKIDEGTKSCEIGYCIGQPWWGNGFTAEALQALVSFFLDTVGFLRVFARHDTNNPNSGKVMRKCNMTFEGIARQAGRNNQGIVDIATYSILAQDPHSR
jgi:ribosomal-protein-alanine N-acetyltransferase